MTFSFFLLGCFQNEKVTRSLKIEKAKLQRICASATILSGICKAYRVKKCEEKYYLTFIFFINSGLTAFLLTVMLVVFSMTYSGEA